MRSAHTSHTRCSRAQSRSGSGGAWHEACALSKAACEDAEATFPTLWAAVQRTRLRDKKNIPPIGTILNYGVLRDTVVRRSADDVHHIEVQTDKVGAALRRIQQEMPQLFCINNIPSRATWETVKAALDSLFGNGFGCGRQYY